MAAEYPILRWIFVIPGFLQSHGSPQAGLVPLWRQLHWLRCRKTTRVELCLWNDNWPARAECVWRSSRLDGSRIQPEIIVIAYSWGAGWGLLGRGRWRNHGLARCLDEYGLSVTHAVLSDPVYRSRWLAFRWLALCYPTIRVPENVMRITWFRQDRDWPRGHNLVAEGRDTIIETPVWMRVGHSKADEAPGFHRAALDAAGIDVNGATAH